MEIFEILSIVASPITEAGKALVFALGRQASYLISYKRNVENLNQEMQKLGRMRNGVQGRVDAALRSGQVVDDAVQGWLASVNSIEAETRTLGDQVHERRRCFDLCSQYNIGREAKKKTVVINELQREGNFNIVSHPAPPPRFESLPSPDFMSFKSTESAMKQIMDALKNESISIIGVYGMGGVGKTTLMRKIAKQVEKDELFSKVVMVTLTQKPDLKMIQIDIARQLDLPPERYSEQVRTGKLSERLKLEGKILIILDNLWERLELKELGISSENDHKGCKIIFTTRSQDVCSVMESKEDVAVGFLSEQDAWILFNEKAGDIVNSPALQTVAMDVANECGGLPLAIVTLGRALRNKEPRVWYSVLEQLRMSDPRLITDMDQKVFASLELSYNFLETEDVKLCFLFCSLFPEGVSIKASHMIRYAMGEGFLENVDTMEQASHRVHALFDKLTASCLLLKGDEGTVKMHDVVRHVAIKIASRHAYGFLVRAGKGLTEWPERENIQKCKRISFVRNQISKLPDQIKCPQLLTLLLCQSSSLENIPDGFFRGMNSLKVLDLCNTCISMLPSSLQCLVNLRTLCLDRCDHLTDMTALGGLKKLEILSLQGTIISELPKEIGELTNLKVLDLRDNDSLQMVSSNVISRLTLLEELYISGYGKWEVKGSGDGRQARFDEIASLSHLTTLDLWIENTECLSQDISGPWKNLSDFHIIVGEKIIPTSISSPFYDISFPFYGHIYETIYYDPWENQPDFHIIVGENIKPKDTPRRMTIANLLWPISNWVKLMLERTKELELVDCKDLENVGQINEVYFSCLKTLHISNCAEVKHIISVVEEEDPRNVFEGIEELYLDELKNLEKLCHGPLPARFLKSLRIFKLSRCIQCINILPSDLLQALQNLEELEINGCKEILEVFHHEGLVEGPAVLLKLQILKLVDLPRLTSIWKGAIPLGTFNNLEKLYVEKCRRLRCLFSLALAQRLQQLKWLNISYCENMEKLMVAEETNAFPESQQSEIMPPPDLLPLGIFQNLRGLIVCDCGGFKNLFTLSFARGLQQLEILTVQRCQGVEVVIKMEEDQVIDKCVFPQLKKLSFRELERLTIFNEGGALDWPSLESISVQNCPNFKRFPLQLQSVPKLEEMGSREWFDALVWEDQNLKPRLQPFLEQYDRPPDCVIM